MTFIFFLGIFLVFLPLGLGFGWFGGLINQFHDWIYLFGGIFLIILALFIFLGFHPRLPLKVSPKMENQGIASIFLLGVFSGLATTCCAPVLAGVLALSILPGSIFWGGMYALTYVLGMVLPLFIIALFLDKVNFTEKFLVFKKAVNYKILGKEVFLTLAQLFSALMFLSIGFLIVSLTLTGRLRMESDMLVRVNILVAKYLNILEGALKDIPWFVIPVLFIFIVFVIIRASLNQINPVRSSDQKKFK